MPVKPKPDKEETVIRDGIEYEEVTHDDQVIGRAFRVSLGILLVMAATGGGAWWWINRPEKVAPTQEIETSAPQTVTNVEQAPAVRFTDMTTASGIDFVHENGAEGQKLLPETMGGGSAFLDYDADGDPDLLFVNGCFWPESQRTDERPTQALYSNDGGRFTNVTLNAGLDATFYGMGASCADADSDGDTDLFFTAVGPNHFFTNEGGASPSKTSACPGPGTTGAPAPVSSTPTTTATSTCTSATTCAGHGRSTWRSPSPWTETAAPMAHRRPSKATNPTSTATKRGASWMRPRRPVSS